MNEVPVLTPIKSEPPAAPSRPTMHWAFQIQQYGTALGVAAFLFLVLSVYLFFRRGYYDLYIINKVVAGVAAIMLGLILLIGSLSRMFNRFDGYVQYRKELGITAYFLLLFHGFSSFFLLPDHFTQARFFGSGLWPFLYGLAATILLTFILLISNKVAMQKIGPKRWWHIQNWGIRIGFVLVALHVGVMKLSGWISWYREGGSETLVHPEWPGAGLLVGWFMAFVIFVRLAEAANKKLGVIAWYLLVFALPLIYILTFLWGYYRV